MPETETFGPPAKGFLEASDTSARPERDEGIRAYSEIRDAITRLTLCLEGSSTITGVEDATASSGILAMRFTSIGARSGFDRDFLAFFMLGTSAVEFRSGRVIGIRRGAGGGDKGMYSRGGERGLGG